MSDGNKNLQSLIAAGFVKETIDGEDYLILKSFKGRRNGTDTNEQEYAIKASDIGGGTTLGPGVPITVCDITLENSGPVIGPVQSFEVLGTPNSGDPANGFAIIDLANRLVFFRDTDGGSIYNPLPPFLDPDGYGPNVPTGTVWNSSFVDPVNNGFGDLTNLTTRTYGTFFDACNGAIGNNVVGLELVMYFATTDTYYLVTFTNWDNGNSAPYGGFAFDLQEVQAAPECVITFSDGSTMSTAPTPSVNTDRSLMPGVAFVTPTGNNITGTVGDQNLPYQSIVTASFNADIIIILPGVYTENIPLENGKTYYAMPGVRFSGGSLTVPNANTTATWLGSAVFDTNHDGLTITGANSVIHFEFDRMDNTRTVLQPVVDCDVTVVCNSILCHGLNGFGGAMTIRNGANVTMNVANFFHGQHRLCFFRAATLPYSGRFEITCPDMRILDNYQASYGNVAKGVFEFDQTDGAEFIFNGDMTIEHPVQGSGGQRGCLGFAQQINGTSTIVVNGNLNGGPANPAIFTGFNAISENIVINGNVKSEGTNPIQLTRTGGGVGIGCNISFNNSLISGALNCTITNGNEAYFRNCSFWNADPTLNAANIVYSAGGGGDASELYFYNCIAENAASAIGAEFISGGAAIGTLGCHNTVSADPLGAGSVDSFGGYSQIAGIKVPKI